MSAIGFLETVSRDVQYAWRIMLKNPAFALTAVLTLALGIGANTTMFTVVNAVLLKPLDYREPERLVRTSAGATVTKFEAIAQARSFTAAGAFLSFTENVAISGTDSPEPLKGARVSPEFLQILGIAPLLGRSFLAGEDKPGPDVAMSKYPPAKPGALLCEPPKAAMRGR